jgi:hypothetical protein
MKALPDNFTVDPELSSKRRQHADRRVIEARLAEQCRAVVDIQTKREQVKLNPLADALKSIKL